MLGLMVGEETGSVVVMNQNVAKVGKTFQRASKIHGTRRDS